MFPWKTLRRIAAAEQMKAAERRRCPLEGPINEIRFFFPEAESVQWSGISLHNITARIKKEIGSEIKKDEKFQVSVKRKKAPITRNTPNKKNITVSPSII